MLLKRKSPEEKALSKALNKMTFWLFWNTGILPVFIVIGVILGVLIASLWSIAPPFKF